MELNWVYTLYFFSIYLLFNFEHEVFNDCGICKRVPF